MHMDLPTPPVPPNAEMKTTDIYPNDAPWIRRLKFYLMGPNTPIRKAGHNLFMYAWHNVPAGSLPDNQEILARISGLFEKWSSFRFALLDGWNACSDGNLYHPALSKSVQIVLEKRQKASERKAFKQPKRDGNSKCRPRVDSLDPLTGVSESLSMPVASESLSESPEPSGGEESSSPPDGGSPSGKHACADFSSLRKPPRFARLPDPKRSVKIENAHCTKDREHKVVGGEEADPQIAPADPRIPGLDIPKAGPRYEVWRVAFGYMCDRRGVGKRKVAKAVIACFKLSNHDYALIIDVIKKMEGGKIVENPLSYMFGAIRAEMAKREREANKPKITGALF